MDSASKAAKFGLALLMLPLSLLPFVFGVPAVFGEYHDFSKRYLERKPVPVPVHGNHRSWRALPVYDGAVPVLVYRGVGTRRDGATVSPAEFVAQMAMLDDAGFHSITIEQYAACIGAGRCGLPARPVLIAFEEPRLATYRNADPVLARHHFTATLFVRPNLPAEHHLYYLGWDELRRMSSTGRWQIQQSAPIGRTGPKRLAAAVVRGEKKLRAEIPLHRAVAIELPWGVYPDSDATLRSRLQRVVRERYEVAFGHRAARFSRTADRRTDLPRFELRPGLGAAGLYAWLERRA